MATFAESFAQGFQGPFQQGMQTGAAVGLQQIQRQNQLKDMETMTGLLDQVTAGQQEAQQDRQEGMQTLATLSATVMQIDAVRKPFLKTQVKRMRESGVNISPEAEQILLNLKGEEGAAMIDALVEQAEADPNFGNQSLLQVLSDPQALFQVMNKASTSVVQQQQQQEAVMKGEGATPAERELDLLNKKNQHKIDVESAKVQRLTQEIQSLQNAKKAGEGRFNTAEGLKNYRTMVDSMIESRKDEAQSIIDGIRELEGRIESRQTSLAMDQLNEQQLLARPGQEFRDIDSLVQGQVISQEKGNELKVASVTPRSDFTFISEDGVVTASGNVKLEEIAQTTATRTAAKNREETIKSLKEEGRKIIPAATVVSNIFDNLDEAEAMGGNVQSVAGALYRVLNKTVNQYSAVMGMAFGENGQISSITDVDSDGKPYTIDVSTELLDLPGNFERFGELATVVKSQFVGLAYMMAKLKDPTGRVSDKDFDNALERIGGSSGDPNTLRVVLSDLLSESVTTLKGKVIYDDLQDEVKTDFASRVFPEMGLRDDILTFSKTRESNAQRGRLIQQAQDAISQGRPRGAVVKMLEEKFGVTDHGL